MAVGEASSMERPTTSDKLQSVPFSVATNGTFTVAPNTLTDTSTGSVRSRAWELGDGTVSRSQVVDHAWSEPGFYNVTLRVRDGVTEPTASSTFLVKASEPAGSCVADAVTRCLRDSRYVVQRNGGRRTGGAATARWSTRGPTSRVCSGSSTGTSYEYAKRKNRNLMLTSSSPSAERHGATGASRSRWSPSSAPTTPNGCTRRSWPARRDDRSWYR